MLVIVFDILSVVANLRMRNAHGFCLFGKNVAFCLLKIIYNFKYSFAVNSDMVAFWL